MDQPYDLAALPEQDQIDDPLVERTSADYLGRWHHLVSTTNWEKGRIICQWRDALVEAGASAAACSDEAWSRRVGSVTPQHVGRLRRVFQRFGQTCDQYAGLYWSHFQAALDWLDAEMWLEGAVQNGWSVAQMRGQRWEAIGAPAELKPRAEDVIAAEIDEDVVHDDEAAAAELTGSIEDVHDTQPAAHSPSEAGDAVHEAQEAADADEPAPAAVPFRPFENLAALPADLDTAFESFKLAILHHKVAGWQETSCDAVLAALEALKQLAIAPA